MSKCGTWLQKKKISTQAQNMFILTENEELYVGTMYTQETFEKHNFTQHGNFPNLTILNICIHLWCHYAMSSCWSFIINTYRHRFILIISMLGLWKCGGYISWVNIELLHCLANLYLSSAMKEGIKTNWYKCAY